MLWLCWFWLFESHLRTSRTPQRGLWRWTLHTATSTLRYNSASNCSLSCIAFEQTLLNVRILSVSFERKGLQALLQRLSIDVPPQRQGMCLPEGQSRHYSTCCIGHQLSLWLHSQPFWSLIIWTVLAPSNDRLFEQCFLQATSTWLHLLCNSFPWETNVHVLVCSIRLEQDMLTEAHKACWDKQTCWIYCALLRLSACRYSFLTIKLEPFGGPEQH